FRFICGCCWVSCRWDAGVTRRARDRQSHALVGCIGITSTNRNAPVSAGTDHSGPRRRRAARIHRDIEALMDINPDFRTRLRERPGSDSEQFELLSAGGYWMSIQRPEVWLLNVSSTRALEGCDRWKVAIYASDG